MAMKVSDIKRLFELDEFGEVIKCNAGAMTQYLAKNMISVYIDPGLTDCNEEGLVVSLISNETVVAQGTGKTLWMGIGKAVQQLMNIRKN